MRYFDSAPRKTTKTWEDLVKLNSTYSSYAFPPRGSEAEMKSFRLQCEKHILEYKTPSDDEIKASDSRLLPLFITHNLPHYLASYDRDSWSQAINEMKNYIKKDASPGVPCSMVSNKNEEFLSRMGERFNDIVLQRIENILALTLDEISRLDRRRRIDLNLMDPVRVFVKNEPHKRAKLEEGRVRLIMSVSLVDKVIEMLISRHLCKLEIQNWRTIPAKPGIGFTKDQVEHVYKDVMNSGFEMAYADVSGWDWGVKQWQILDEAESLIKLCNNSSAVWEHLVRAKAILESESVYQFSNGLLVAPTYKGIVNSGKLRTSRGNSWMRSRLADLIGARKVIAMGDDTVEHYVEDAPDKYLEYGIRCKDYVQVRDSFEFCSRWYFPGGSYPVNKAKMVMNLANQTPKNFMEYKMSMLSFEDEMRDHPEYQEILQELDQVGFMEVEGPHFEIENEC